MRTSAEQRRLEERLRRAREILYMTEREAKRLKVELLPSEDVPVIGERTLRALDFVNEWVSEAHVVHRLAERELAKLRERRS